MIATIIKIQKKKSQYGGYFYYVFFKGADSNTSYYTCVYERMKNFRRWKDVLDVGTVLSNLHLVKKGNNKKLIDADSRFKIVEEDK